MLISNTRFFVSTPPLTPSCASAREWILSCPEDSSIRASLFKILTHPTYLTPYVSPACASCHDRSSFEGTPRRRSDLLAPPIPIRLRGPDSTLEPPPWSTTSDLIATDAVLRRTTLFPMRHRTQTPELMYRTSVLRQVMHLATHFLFVPPYFFVKPLSFLLSFLVSAPMSSKNVEIPTLYSLPLMYFFSV